MRNLIVAVSLVIFIVAVNILIGRYIKESYDDFSALGDEYLSSLEESNYDEAEKTLNVMIKDWEKNEFYLKWVANHETVESIGANFKISEIYLKYKNAPLAAAQCKELMHFLQHLYESEQVNLDNIF
jgi:hypothetical protein